MKKNTTILVLTFFTLSALETQSSNNKTLEKRAQLATELKDYRLSESCNLNLLARAFKSQSAAETTKHINLTKKIASKNNPSIITMRNFEMAIDEIEGGAELGFLHPKRINQKKYLHESAIHEAGHILASVKHPKLVTLFGSIALRKNSAGFNFAIPTSENYKDFTHNEIEMVLMQNMAGPVAEQVFNIPNESRLTFLYRSIVKQSHQPKIELSFEELINRQSAQQDLEQVKNYIRSAINDNLLREEDALNIIESVYQETVKLVQNHTTEIQQLANALERETYISMDEIYKICNTIRPKLDIESNLT